ncbi:MAG TPA: L,D-transpeptidase family protein [Candidatus Sulfotelmatobacter sp.]|nr:L,D-transpeptidase family protein [Candidatus Sulfotelmatobacter sp.]
MKKRVALLFWFGLCVMACSSGNVAPTAKTGSAAAQTPAAPQSLSATGGEQLRGIIASGRLSDLQWPNFSSDQPAVKEFYDESGQRLGWISNGRPTPQALEVIELLQQADAKGLDPKDYDGERWPDRLKVLQGPSAATEDELVKFDVALTVSAIRYGSDLHLGKVDPKVLHKDFDPDREKHNPGEFLWKNVVSAPDVKQVVASIEPPYPGYQRTLAALQKYLLMAKNEVPDPLPQVSKPILPGQSYEAVGKLVRRLQFLSDLPASVTVPEGSQAYTAEVVDGVKHFQTRHGLEAAGKLGPQTITELNRPISDRVESLRLTLERWRWIPDNFAQPPIIVNIPEFVLRAYDSPGKPALVMRVVVGRAMRTQTPLLEEDMKYVVFWPYWNVPPSILRGEVIPKIVKDPAYIQKNSFEVATYSGQVVTDGVVSDDVLAQLQAGKLMVRQKPGPKNALGLIKFIFPNDQNIYLHSTPAQALFSETRRDFSHGCIRVENPQALAEWVLRNNPGWTRDRIETAFKAQKEQQVNLTSQIPVFLVYGTAIVKENEEVFFFDDIYGYDKALKKAFDTAYAADQ